MSEWRELMRLEPDGTLHLYDTDGADLITVMPSGDVQIPIDWTLVEAMQQFRLAVVEAANQPPTAAGAATPTDSNQQTCKACGRVDKFNFSVPDEIWQRVVPEHLRTRVVCLTCFDDLAAAAGVKYAPHLNDVLFVGHGAILKFAEVAEVAEVAELPIVICYGWTQHQPGR